MLLLYWYIFHHFESSFSSHGEYDISQCLRYEARFAVRKIVLPLPLEQLNVALGHAFMLFEKSLLDIGIKVTHELFTPESQCLCVMGADILNGFWNEVA